MDDIDEIRRARERMGGKHTVTPEIAAELQAEGIDIDDRFQVLAAEDDDHVVVCLRETRPLAHADNLVAPCTFGCGYNVQFRPLSERFAEKICVVCVNAGGLDRSKN